MAICECGCGLEIPWQPHHRHKPARFIPGHWQKSNEFLEQRARLRLQPPPDAIPDGFCQCGCGQRTAICKSSGGGNFIGYPKRFVHGHQTKGKRGELSPRWSGGRWQNKLGYWLIHKPDHPAANASGYVYEHLLVWEEVNGKRKQPNEHIHHIDGNPSNNSPDNLIALTRKQHVRLHAVTAYTKKRKSEGGIRRFQNPEERERFREIMREWWRKRKEGN